MILCNSSKVDEYFEHDMELRQYVMATTVMTPKLTQLLDILQSQYQGRDCKISEIVTQYRHKCATYINDCILNVTNLNPTILRLAAKLYYTYDDVLVVSSIQDKIIAWKIAYQIAERQVLGHSSVKISVSDIQFVQANNIDLSKDSIAKELHDLSDEIWAWFELYFDDYNDHDDSKGQHDYDEILAIMTDLHFLADILATGK